MRRQFIFSYFVLLNQENLFVFERLYSRLIFIRFFFSANSHFFNDKIVLTLSMVTQHCGNRLLGNLEALIAPCLPFIAAGATLKMFTNTLLCNPSTRTRAHTYTYNVRFYIRQLKIIIHQTCKRTEARMDKFSFPSASLLQKKKLKNQNKKILGEQAAQRDEEL